MYFDSNFLDYLRSKITLSDVIGRSVHLTRKGRDKIACCPFHKEKTPSFHVNDEKGFYHCFGCGTHGDVITFVMQQEGLSFVDAVKKLASDYGVELPKNNETFVKKDNTEIIYEINEKTCQFFENNLINSKVALNYLRSRGLNLEQAKSFRIGYAQDNFNALIDFLKSHNFKEEDMLKAGVVAFNNNYYDKFRHRIMFPVLDKVGKVIAFTGRVINKEDIPKYMNSPETLIYHKSSVLFNYFYAKKSIYDEKKAFLVEGNLDVITMSINGIKNVVAPMGTAVTVEQIEELWKACDHIIVCLDGDSAGQKASVRVANLVLPLLRPMKDISFVALPEGQDPDDFVKHNGKNYFLNFVQNNILSLSEFLWKNESKNIDTTKFINAEEKTQLETKLNSIIKSIKNNTVARNFDSFFKGKMFFITRYKKELNYKDYTKIDYNKNKPLTVEDLLIQNIKNIEKNIFSLIISQISIIDRLFQDYNIDIFNMSFISEKSKQMINIFLKIYELNNIEDKNFLINTLEKNNLNNYITLSNKYKTIDDEKKVKFLYSLILERNINVLQLEMKRLAMDNNDEEKRKILEKELEIVQKKKGVIDDDLQF